MKTILRYAVVFGVSIVIGLSTFGILAWAQNNPKQNAQQDNFATMPEDQRQAVLNLISFLQQEDLEYMILRHAITNELRVFLNGDHPLTNPRTFCEFVRMTYPNLYISLISYVENGKIVSGIICREPLPGSDPESDNIIPEKQERQYSI